MEYRVFNKNSFDKIDVIKDNLSKEDIEEIKIVSKVFPFKINNNTLELID